MTRLPRMLRNRAEANRSRDRMNEIDRVVSHHLTPGRPETFYATSGDSSIERAGVGWMPHDYKPIIGFAPNV